MILDKQKKYIYIHIPKNAGVSMQYALSKAKGHPSNARTKGFYDHITCKELIKKLGDTFDTYYSFAFVRNPWDWMHSLYYYVLQHSLKRWRHLLPYYEQLGFNEWVVKEYEKWIIKMTPWHSNLIPLQQIDWISNSQNEIIVSFVGRYENLLENFQFICKRIKVDTTLGHSNKTKHIHYRNEYTQEAIDKVEQLFNRDISYFNYEY